MTGPFDGRKAGPLVWTGLAVLSVLAIALSALTRGLWREDPAARTPSRYVLWAWERPEDLRFVNSVTTAVASLEGTVWIEGARVTALPRQQPLHLPRGVEHIAVVRIETSRDRPPPLDRAQVERIADAVERFVRPAGDAVPRPLQIDFDALHSERRGYRSLLKTLRQRLPDHPLSITALASWCAGDRWIDDLPIDHAVPMLFRMGPDGLAIRASLARDGTQGHGPTLSSPICRGRVGISTDEALPTVPTDTHTVYVFHPRSWTPDAWRPIEEALSTS